MKQLFHSRVFLLLLALLVLSSELYARSLDTKQVKKGNFDETSREDSASDTADNEHVNVLMGLDLCDNKDVECLKKRMISDPHLDYIYTQHHKH